MHLDTYIILSKFFIFICTRFRNRSKREPMARFSCPFCSKCNTFLLWQYVYYVYPAMSKSFKILLKRAETSIVSIVFKGVLSALCCYLTVCSTWIRY